MTWTLLNLQLFPTQLLQDLWTSAPTGTSFKDLITPVSHPWLQETFYNLSPDEIDFFTLILYIILHPNEHVPPQIQTTTNLGPSAPRPDWPLPVSLTITALLILVLAIGLVTVSPQDWSPIRLFVGITYVASCVLLLGCYFLHTV